MRHNRPCKQLPCHYTGPEPDQNEGEDSVLLHLCARCQTKTQTLDGSAPRSEWAQPRLNPFLCENCHWDRVGRNRELLDPPTKYLKCLCTRRENLGILLINRRFHEEAAFIFWTENWFAFEHLGLFIGFVSALQPHIRSLIRQITVLPDPDILPDWMSSKQLAWWKSLKQCPDLRIVEIDALLLSNQKCVFGLRTLHAKERVSFMRQVQFKDWSNINQGYPNSYIWPAQYLRRPSTLPFAEMFGASLTGKGFKTKWLKRAYFESQLYIRESEKPSAFEIKN